jgi:SAM-dependent methyltransferase
MSWRDYFDRAAQIDGASPRTSRYVDLRSFEFQRAAILDWLGPVGHQRVLDAGCGVGAFAEPLIASNDVCGVDFSERSLAHARARGLLAACADVEALPLASSSFDVVLCVAVLQLLPELDPTIRELVRVLRPGGTLVVGTLNGESPLHHALARLRPGVAPLHLHSTTDVTNALARCGIVSVDRLHMYYPLRVSTRATGATWRARWLSTSFALRGRKTHPSRDHARVRTREAVRTG